VKLLDLDPEDKVAAAMVIRVHGTHVDKVRAALHSHRTA
jgi:hypothetical protein